MAKPKKRLRVTVEITAPAWLPAKKARAYVRDGVNDGGRYVMNSDFRTGQIRCVAVRPEAKADPVTEVAVAMLPIILDTFGTFFETFQPDDWTAEEYPEVAKAADIFKRLHAAGYRGPK